jgi:tetratricopeptide (TPR) repeat protein
MALMYSRFLPEKDFGQAEAYVELGLQSLAEAAVEDRERIFLRVFLMNGLAYIRNKQGRPEAALELCRQGVNLLDEKLEPSRHLLHRSVLLYNMAQVYSSLGEFDLAVEYLGQAMEYDPHYSEYYNERGNAYLALGRIGKAISDYRVAIDLSSPYPEVWANLGQALKLSQQIAEASRAYTRALDLDPRHRLAYVGRAQCLDMMGRTEEALDDYSSALELDRMQPFVLANRATLLFQLGRVEESLADLDAAIAILPNASSLLLNRAIALEALGRYGKAIEDLHGCLELPLEEEQRTEIRKQLLANELRASEAAQHDTSRVVQNSYV